MIRRSDVRGVVLAGGDSTRFGEADKALADLSGRPLVAHVVGALADGTAGRPLVAVSTADEGDALRRALAEGDGGEGPSDVAESDANPLAAGENDAGAPVAGEDGADDPVAGAETGRTGATGESSAPTAVETVTDAPDYAGPLGGLLAAAAAADRPWLFVVGCDMPLVSVETVDALREAVTPDADAVVPVVGGHDQPLHALYRRSAVDALRDGLPERAGLRTLVDGFDDVVRIPADGADAPLSDAVANVNTRADLERLRERFD
ncbi:MAG: molybdenum cofactor guanylyltransferase [Haloarculaceae archaeon]